MVQDDFITPFSQTGGAIETASQVLQTGITIKQSTATASAFTLSVYEAQFPNPQILAQLYSPEFYLSTLLLTA